MRKNRLFTTICLMAVALLAACTQDELAEQGNTLPEGEYPLQIGSVSITAEASEEPWTRVTEKPDGSGSVFQGGERIGVRIGDNEETGVYIIKVDDAGNVTVEPDKPVYWKNTQPAEVTAWYPATDGALFLGGQVNGLVYVLRATADNASHNTPVNLQFEHQLAKVRVIVKGTADVTDVEPINVPMSCDVKEGKIVNIGMPRNHPMFKTTYEDIGPCWEINLPPSPDYQIENFVISTSDPIDIQCDITPSITLEAGKVHTFTLTVHRKDTKTIDLSNNDYIINDDGTYYFSDTGSHAIRVTGGNPNIYLEDAQISVSGGNAIDIQGNASPTIHVKGNDNEVSSSDGAGIYVAGSSTVTITGRSRDDALTTRGGNGGSGIGGNHATCGNIEISNMTVHAHGSDENGDFLSAGIGGSGNNGCGTITIDNATISAYGASDGAAGNMSSPGIGGGLDGNNKGTYSTITIKNNSQVSVQRGSNRSDYIGSGGSTMNPANSPNGIDATVDETSTITPLN